MKILLSIIILLFSQKPSIIEVEDIKMAEYIKKQISELRYNKNYQKTIDFIKYHEGFSDSIYDDKGFDCIGYGQRIIFYQEKIQEPLTKYRAEEILKRSFQNHIKIVKKVWPWLNQNQNLAVAHMSYCIGIGRIKKLKLIEGKKLNVEKLLKLDNKQNRLFEIEMFYAKY